jgi:hypothetical protein
MTMDDDRAREIAAAAGLSNLDSGHLTALSNGVASARELAGKLPKDLHWSEEIVLVFRLPAPARSER